jgi:hypothetical protein
MRVHIRDKPMHSGCIFFQHEVLNFSELSSILQFILNLKNSQFSTRFAYRSLI